MLIPCNDTLPALCYAQAIMRTTSIAEGRFLGSADKHLLINCATASGHSSGTLHTSNCQSALYLVLPPAVLLL